MSRRHIPWRGPTRTTQVSMPRQDTQPQSPSESRLSSPVIPRKVNGRHGLLWLGDAITILRQQPLMWVMVGLCFFLILLMTLLISAIIAPALSLLTSVVASILLGGILFGCDQLSEGLPFKFEHLFAGLDHKLLELVQLGLLYASGTLIVSLVSSLVFTMLGLELPEYKLEQPVIEPLPIEFLLLLLLFLLLMAPLLMAYWFAPALIVCRNMSALQALKSSYRACAMNMLAFTYYGVFALMLLFVGFSVVALTSLVSVPLALLLNIAIYLLFFSLTLISIYTSFADIYPARRAGENVTEDNHDDMSQLTV